MVISKVRGLPPSVTVQEVVKGPVKFTAGAAVSTSLRFKGRTIFGRPVSSRIPSFNSMFFPGTIAAATQKDIFIRNIQTAFF